MFLKSFWFYSLVFVFGFLAGGGGVTLKGFFIKPPIVVVFASDERYVPYLGVTLTSLIEHVSQDNTYKIFVLSDNISNENQSKLKTLADNHKNVQINFVDVRTVLQKIKALNFPTDENFSEATYFRFFIPELFANYKKVLYLDADLIITVDIAELFNIDLGNAIVGAAHQTPGADEQYAYLRGDYMKSLLNIYNPSLYFNAGVLLINVSQAREDSFTPNLLGWMKKIKNPPLYDQDILNAAYAKSSFKFSYLYNFEPQFAKEYEHIPYIIHFSGQKPWKDSWPGNPAESKFFSLFWQYARKSPFKDKIWAEADERFCINGDLFIHPYWTGFIKRLPQGRLKRCQNADEADILGETTNHMRIKWDNWGEETFERQADGSYKLKKDNIF